jgi:hypothetical protein
MNSKEDWVSNWRASAYEAVPYTDDFPECLLVLPELIDGAIGHGAASRVNIHIELPAQTPGSSQMGVLRIKDNGAGITSVNRMLSWAAASSTHMQHRYGHGSKKCLTKWMRDYDKANWSLSWRKKDKKGLSGSLHTIKAPFIGRDTPIDEDDKNETTLHPSGTEWVINFDVAILGLKFRNAENLFDGIKEILRTRYSEKYFNATEFVIEIAQSGKKPITETSKVKKWRSFQQMLDDEVRLCNAYVEYDDSVPISGGTLTYKQYKIAIDGKASFPLKTNFPVLGHKNMLCARAHIALDGRTIEACHLYKIYEREANHNDFNGMIAIINMIPTNDESREILPQPCTTKVSFYDNCPYFKAMLETVREILKKQPNAMPDVVYNKQDATRAAKEAAKEAVKEEKERKKKEVLEKQRLEKERLEKDRLEKQRLWSGVLEKERLEKERLEKERLEKERLEKERLEKAGLDKNGLEKERLEKERLEKERLEKERLEKERLEKERLEKERLEKERLEKERLEKEKEKEQKKSKASNTATFAFLESNGTITVNFGQSEFAAVSYAGDSQLTIKFLEETLRVCGQDKFKKWLPEFVKANKLLN